MSVISPIRHLLIGLDGNRVPCLETGSFVQTMPFPVGVDGRTEHVVHVSSQFQK